MTYRVVVSVLLTNLVVEPGKDPRCEESQDGGTVSLEKAFELPFVPFVGLGLLYGPDEGTDEITLEEVIWDYNDKCFYACVSAQSFEAGEDLLFFEKLGWKVTYTHGAFGAWAQRRHIKAVPDCPHAKKKPLP